MSTYADPRDVEIQMQVVDLYLFGLMPQEIQAELNFQYFQPIYNILKKAGVYEKRPTRYHRKHFFNERFFQTIDTEEKAYFLGLIAADGSVASDAQRMVIALQARDRDILEKLLIAVEASFDVMDIDHQGHPQVKVALNSKIMRQDLIDKGIHPVKSLTLSSEVMSHIPDHLIRHFIRGFFDGDGNVSLGSTYSSGTKYSVAVIGTKEFLESSFIKYCKSNSKLRKHKECEMWYWVTSSTANVFGFLKYIYEGATVFLDRKYNYVRDYVLSECAHVKSGELLEIFAPEKVKDNQQPSLLTNRGLEGSETIERAAAPHLVEYAQASGSA